MKRFSDSEFKYWKTSNKNVGDFYALDVLRMLTEKSISRKHLKGNKELSGRVNSSIKEQTVIDVFTEYKDELKEYGIDLITDDKMASIEDFKLKFKSRFIFTNVKITSSKSSDNAISWKTICFCLIDDIVGVTKGNFTTKLQHLTEIAEVQNYYFFVVNKLTKDITINSILTLQKATSNPSNQPMQIRWDNRNKTPSFKEIVNIANDNIQYILKTAMNSLKKNIDNETKMYETLESLVD